MVFVGIFSVAHYSLAAYSLESLTRVPEIQVDSVVLSDISSVDWDQKVNINGKETALNSDEALDILALPEDVKHIIRSYREEKNRIDSAFLMFPSTKREEKELLDQGLKFSLEKKLVEQGYFSENYFSLKEQGFVETNLMNIKDGKTLDVSRAVGVEPSIEITDIETVEPTTVRNIFENIKNTIDNTLDNLVGLLSSSAYADATTVSTSAIDYLVSQQNVDGSWGADEARKFILTVAVVDALQSQGYVGTVLDNGIAWIQTYVPENNDYRAQRLEVLAHAGIGVSDSATMLTFGLDDTGGFKYDLDHEADPLTTAKAIQGLFAADYEDSAEVPHVTQSLAINYLINTQNEDNGWSVFENGASTIPINTEIIEGLLLWKHQLLGDIEVDDTLDPAVSSLVTAQDSDGSWDGEVLNSALVYHAIKAVGADLTFSTEALEYFEDEQEVDGSFLNDIYITAKVVKALSLSGAIQGQLSIDDIVPLSTLQTGLLSQVKILVTNHGSVAVDKGILHIIVDDYKVSSIDFLANNIVVNPGETKQITLSMPSTRNYVGNVSFKMFIEGLDGVIHSDSRYQETLTYNQDPALRPGLPIYFVAYKNVSAGSPAVTWKWGYKDDPNRANYVLMWRLVGAATWTTSTLDPTATSATVSGFAEDTLYEATIGTADALGSIYYFTSSSQVMTSSTGNEYKAGTVEGTVKSVDGTVEDVDVLGVIAGANGHTDENGAFAQTSTPWGTGYAKVSNFLYESYTTKYTNTDDSLLGVSVYTNKIIDTKKPTVSNVLIVGEDDKKMENKEVELIQYTIKDDIKSAGNAGIVQSASFYYFDPLDGLWHLIGTEEGLLMNTRTYEWHIPDTLVGTGYKIQVILRDFSGKDSKPVSWGTFKLFEGNESPAFTFIAPAPVVTSEADDSFLIQWNDEDPEDNATIMLYYDLDSDPYNANHVFIASLFEDSPEDAYILDTSILPEDEYYIRSELDDGVNETVMIYSGTLSIQH